MPLIKKGQHLSRDTEFKKGLIPWNKGKKLPYIPRPNQIGKVVGEKSPCWKGGKPNCIDCGKKLSLRGYKRCRMCNLHFHSGKNHYLYGKKRPYLTGNKHPNWKKQLTKDERIRLKKMSLKGLLKQQTMKEPTSIEKKVYEELKKRGLLFETQKIINGRFLVDAYIPKLNLIIEVDGDYWHSLDRVIKKDKAENAYLTKCGYKLLRLSETEINNTNFGERIG